MAMRILSSMLKQRLVLWDNPVADGYGGYIYDDPVEIACRWEEKREKFLDAAGEEVLSRAIVYVGQDVAEGAMIALVDSDWPDSSGVWVGAEPTDSGFPGSPIRRFEKLPTLAADGYLRTCYI